MGLMSWFSSWSDPPPNEVDQSATEPKLQLRIDDICVTCKRPSGVVESVLWDDLQRVSILTTDTGPFAEDVFFVLYGSNSDSGCVVPQSIPNTRGRFKTCLT